MCEKKHEQIDTMARDVIKTWHEMLDEAISSGSVPAEYIEDGNYLLVKAVIDCWCQKRRYRPLHLQTQKEFKNIACFI